MNTGTGRFCPKCGQYTEGAWYCSRPRTEEICWQERAQISGEHIHRYCPYCKHEWLDTYPATSNGDYEKYLFAEATRPERGQHALIEIRDWLAGRKALLNCVPIYAMIEKGLGQPPAAKDDRHGEG